MWLGQAQMARAEETRSVDVIVVGAGAAGTMAAAQLARAGKTFVLLEANERVGGRLKRGTIAGQNIDLGGQWIGPTQDRVLEVGAQLGLTTYPTFNTGLMAIELAGQRYQGLNLPPEVLGEYLKSAALIDGLAAPIDLAKPWAAPEAQKWDSMSVAQWIEQTAATPHVRELLRFIVEVVNSVRPEQMSLLQFLWYFKSGSGFAKITGTAGGAQQDLYVEGLVSVPERLAAGVHESLVLGAPVRAIEQNEQQVTAHTAKGSWTAQRLIIAVPPNTAARIEYSPTLPYRRRGLMERSPMGAVIKCFVAYEKPFWREAGLNGQMVASAAAFGSTFDVTAPGNPKGVLCGFFDGGPAMEWSDKTPAERQARVIEDLVHIFGEAAATPLEYVEQNWPQEPWSTGGYACVCGPGVLTTFGEAMREPCGRIHWAGTETAEVWSGYVDGALRSGDRAAAEVIAALGGATAPAAA